MIQDVAAINCTSCRTLLVEVHSLVVLHGALLYSQRLEQAEKILQNIAA
jgi:hypothetical protein